MIGKDSFTLAWLQDLKKKVGRRTDPKLLEKVIHALALLERIQEKGFELIFKGGTSLLLMTDEPVRFSIDIDIVTGKTKEKAPASFPPLVLLSSNQFQQRPRLGRIGGRH